VARGALAAALGVTVVWTDVLLGRTADWFPALRPLVAVAGALAVVGILALPLLRRVPRVAVAVIAALGFGAALAVPLFSTVATATTPHNGAIPSVTPSPSGGFGPGGGFPGGGPGGGLRRAFGGAGGFPGGGLGGGAGFPGGLPGGVNGGTGVGGAFPGALGNGGATSFGGGQRGFGGGGFAGGGPGGGGFLNSSTSNPALTKALQADAGRYTWAAATVNSNSAAGYQLASGEPVMAIGGFNGTDPWPTLAAFKELVAKHEIHYYVSQGSQSFGGGRGSSAIATWVAAHFTKQTVGGQTVYDLTKPLS
jgi:hypothetical protein